MPAGATWPARRSMMIDWLVQRHTDRPPTVEWLSDTERARLATLGSEKRRHDWLLGRWTAKRLAQHWLAAGSDTPPPLEHIIVRNDSDGAPLLDLGPWRQVVAAQATEQPAPKLQLTISHSRDRALCALWGESDLRIGADIEFIEPRDASFASDYFGPNELQLLRGAAPEFHDTLVTAIWSAKESVLKALRLGLTIDTRRFECLIDWPREGGWESGWHGFTVRCAQCEAEWFDAANAAGWWRVTDGFVLTLAAVPR